MRTFATLALCGFASAVYLEAQIASSERDYPLLHAYNQLVEEGHHFYNDRLPQYIDRFDLAVIVGTAMMNGHAGIAGEAFVPAEDMDKWFDMFDSDKDGKLTVDEFWKEAEAVDDVNGSSIHDVSWWF